MLGVRPHALRRTHVLFSFWASDTAQCSSVRITSRPWPAGPLVEAPLSEVRGNLEVNLVAPLHLTQLVRTRRCASPRASGYHGSPVTAAPGRISCVSAAPLDDAGGAAHGAAGDGHCRQCAQRMELHLVSL